MSADVYLQCPTCRSSTEWRNVTYNLGPMLRAAGLGPWDELRGMTAPAAGRHFAAVRSTLEADPVKFSAMNPENGWGSYEGAIEWLGELIRDCHAAAPEQVIGASL